MIPQSGSFSVSSSQENTAKKKGCKFWTWIGVIGLLLLMFVISWVFLLVGVLISEDCHPIPERVEQSQVKHHELPQFGKSGVSKSSHKVFSFVQVFTPSLEEIDACRSLMNCWAVIDKVNRLNPAPKFVLIEASFRPLQLEAQRFDRAIKRLYKLLTLFNWNITLVFIPGDTSSDAFTGNSLNEYTDNFGSDHFDFYINQIKFIVLDSNYDYPSIDDINMSQSKSEHSSFMSLTLDETKDHKTYNHVIVIRSSLKGFNENSSTNGIVDGQNNSSSGMRDHSISFLDELSKYDKITLVTFDGRVKQNGFFANNNWSPPNIPYADLEIEYKKIKRLFLATGLSSRSYRLFTVFQGDVEQQIVL